MKVRTFRAKTMAQTLALVKQHLGRDAVIVNTRTVTRRGLFGFGGNECVEITAAREMSDLPDPLRRGRLRGGLGAERQRTNSGPGRVVNADGAATPVSAAVRTESSGVTTEAVLAEVGALKSLVSDLAYETRRHHVPHVPEQLYDTYRKLIENAVAERIARGLLDRVRDALSADKLRDPQAVRASLAGLLESMLPTSGPIQLTLREKPAVIALIGPTGVGKTTTIAKLAANFCLREQRRVGLITIDTYRIAAVEQLKTYAQIIDVPLEVASSPAQLKDATERMSDRDVILIDTAGRSQRDGLKIKELHMFFQAVKPHEVHLVLSSASAEPVLFDTIERFKRFSPDRIIFTKLDEAIGFGVILNCLRKANAALSYLTTGQDVPDDIEVGQSKALAELIMRERAPQLEGAPGFG